MFRRRIEEASLNSWPALQQILLDGWILRFSKGYTRRANSVNPLYGSGMEVAEKVTMCEDLYSEKGLSPMFRLTAFCVPRNLDEILAACGYEKAAPTSVMYFDVGKCDSYLPTSQWPRSDSLDTWMDAFCRLTGTRLEDHQTHRKILQAIPSKRFLASLSDSGQLVTCGLGVLENRTLGIYDLVTDPEQRNKGYGTKFVLGLLSWARTNGARHAYLQVMSTNSAARHLYTKLGFRDLYAYWYRVTGSAMGQDKLGTPGRSHTGRRA